jgi:histidinol-phosphate aminotransferase
MGTQDLALRGAVAARRLNWSISYLDAVVASTALRSSGWVERTRSALLSTATDMESLLALWHPAWGRVCPCTTGSSPPPSRWRHIKRSSTRPIAVRVFSAAQPGRVSGSADYHAYRDRVAPGWPGCRLVSNRGPSCCSVPSCSAGRQM